MKEEKNEAQKRREQLLKDARHLYREDAVLPVVHPRYQGVYTKLYPNEPRKQGYSHGTFGMRVLISILLLGLFAVADARGLSFEKMDCQTLVQEIKYQVPIEDMIRRLP
ncbi:MAG: hypothetical protein RR869_09275 [Lachnospiraceae bacterium]